MRGLVSSHPVSTFYAVAFAISWGGMALVLGGPPSLPAEPERVDRLMPVVVAALLAGPGLAGLLWTGVLSGREGLRELWSRLLRWRVDARWWAFALLVAPLSMAAVLLPLSLRSSEFLPPIVTAEERAPLLGLAIGTVLLGGVAEELGWTGFAIPRLRRRHGVVATGLVAGLLWGAWHFPVNVWFSGNVAGGIPLSVFAPLYCLAGLAQLTAYRVLMVWVYDRTGSLLVATLMHGSLIASTAMRIVEPATMGAAFLAWFGGSAAALWAVVAALLASGRRRR